MKEVLEKDNVMLGVYLNHTKRSVMHNLLGVMRAENEEEAKEYWEYALTITSNFHKDFGFMPEKTPEQILYSHAEKIPTLIAALIKFNIIGGEDSDCNQKSPSHGQEG